VWILMENIAISLTAYGPYFVTGSSELAPKPSTAGTNSFPVFKYPRVLYDVTA